MDCGGGGEDFCILIIKNLKKRRSGEGGRGGGDNIIYNKNAIKFKHVGFSRVLRIDNGGW